MTAPVVAMRARELPHNLQAERAVLGAFFHDSEAFRAVRDQLEAPHFYELAHQLIFGVCAALDADGLPLDPLIVDDRLQEQGQLGSRVPRGMVINLAGSVAFAGNVRHYAEIVCRLAHRRRIMLAAQAVLQRGYEAGEEDEQYAVEAVAALEAAADHARAPSPVLQVDDIFAPLPPVHFLCEPLDLTPGAPALFAGYGFSGKTVAAQDLALAVATGTPAWGRFPVRQGRVLHIDYEQGARLTRERYQRLALARGMRPEELHGRLALVSLPAWYLDGDARDELTRLCDGHDLVIVDSFRAACPATDENDSAARVPLDRLTRVSEKTGATTVVIHHARKPSQNERGGARMAVRGSGALFDACGSVLVFAAEKGEAVQITHEKARTTGRPHPDFGLWIEDVALEEGPTAGLRISAQDAASSAGADPAARFEGVKARIVELVREAGQFAGGANALEETLGLRRPAVLAALRQLEHAGTIIRSGKQNNPVLTLGTTYDK